MEIITGEEESIATTRTEMRYNYTPYSNKQQP